MFILHKEKFRQALQTRGLRSIQELANRIGVHRNSLQRFLMGRSVLPKSLEKAFLYLEAPISELLVKKKERKNENFSQMSKIIDDLHAHFPDVTFILFGSRARYTQKRYSDWDIGLYRCKEISHDQYRKIVIRGRELAEPLPFFVEFVNLTRATPTFLKEVVREGQFLTGRQSDWLKLQEQIRD